MATGHSSEGQPSATARILDNAAAPPATKAQHRWLVFLLSFVLLAVPMLIWALASPLASVPDEPSHAIRAAAVVRGEIIGAPWAANPTIAGVEVPRYVAHMHELTCFAFHPEKTAGCARPVNGDPDRIVTAGTSAGLNSPLYYAIVGLPTLVLDGTAALYSMRGVNVVLCAGALAIMFMELIQLPRSRWVLPAAFVAVTPMVLFLAGSINPNGIEVAATGALLATLAGTFRATSTRWVSWQRTLVAIVAVALLANARSIGLLWILVILAAALALANREVARSVVRTPAGWVAIAGAALGSIAAVLAYANVPQYAENRFSGAGSSPLTAFVVTLEETFHFAAGYVGFFGWVDTPSPAFSIIAWSAVVVALLMAAFVWGSRRGRWVVAVLGLMIIVIPAIVQAVVTPQIGYIWQGRYMLALFLALLVTAGLALDDTATHQPIQRPLRLILLTGLVLVALGHTISLLSTLRRYIVGVDGSIHDMLVTPHWQPPLGWITLVAVMALWVSAAAWLVYRRTTADGSEAPQRISHRLVDDTSRTHEGRKWLE